MTRPARAANDLDSTTSSLRDGTVCYRGRCARISGFWRRAEILRQLVHTVGADDEDFNGVGSDVM